MTAAEFKKTLLDPQPPPGLNQLLLAMWYDARGDWEKAHNIAQDVSTNDGSWVHAYLHRREGDVGNAGYWYNRAGRSFPNYSLEEEWGIIAEDLLGRS